MKLYAFSLCMQLVILVPYLVKAAHYKQSAGSIALRVLDSLVHAAPPGVTTVMLFCGGAGKVRLSKRGINLVFPEALKLGADTDTVCFDKTGTLTDSLVRTWASTHSDAYMLRFCTAQLVVIVPLCERHFVAFD